MTSETSQGADRSEFGRRWTLDVREMRRRIARSIPVVVAAAVVFGPAPGAADPSTAIGLFSAVRVGDPTPPASTLVQPPADGSAPTARDQAPDPVVIGDLDRVVEPVAARDARPLARPVVEPVAARDVRPLARPVVEPVAARDVRPLARPVVLLYGDSLAWEAREFFAQAFADRTEVLVVERTFGGTAICDWLDQMAEDAATLAPGAVVVEFSGNNMTSCMQDAAGRPLTGTAFLERYAADVEAVIATFVPTGAQVVLAGAPISRTAAEHGDFKGGTLNALYERMGRIHEGVRYADAGAAVLDAGHWTATLQCLPLEPCTGGVDAAGVAVNVVRAPDGGHFCPASEDAVRGVTGACPVWSSGAFRYGSALAGPVIESLDAFPSSR